MTTCQTCHGLRTITITVPNLKGPSNNQYQSSNPPYVTRNYACTACKGVGKVPATKAA